MLEVEQKYNEVRKPVYDKRSDIIKSIPDFWLTAVSDPFRPVIISSFVWFLSDIILFFQFLSHPVLSDLLNVEDQKVGSLTTPICGYLFQIPKCQYVKRNDLFLQIFKHLTSLEVEDFKDMKSGYSITLVSNFKDV